MQEIDASHSPEFDNHKKVFRFEEPEVGLRGFIAIHNDTIGPATGGTRMMAYAHENEALDDVLRLSKAMTYKCALAGVRHGGGKGVIIVDPKIGKTDRLLRSYASKINELKGMFSTGEDVGITDDDVQLMLQESEYFNGRRGIAGEPSPYAALSTFYSIQTAVINRFQTEKLNNISVAVKGVGKVGGELVRRLDEAGADVVIADIDQGAIKDVLRQVPRAKVVDHEEIQKERVDVYAPCALGREFTEENVREVGGSVVCGAANNQLTAPQVGNRLFKMGVLYVPDYVANAGGLINVVDELEPGGYKRSRVLRRVKNLGHTLEKIMEISETTNRATNLVADRLAEVIFENNHHA